MVGEDNELKTKKVLTAAIMTGLLLSSHQVLASNLLEEGTKETVVEPISQQVETTHFMKFSGTVSEVILDEKKMTLSVEGNDLKMLFPITEEVLVLHNSNGEAFQKEKLLKGLKVEVYYDKYMPIPMIYPATIIPNAVIVKTQDLGEVKVSKFDRNFLSLDQELKLNISDETILLNQIEERIKKEQLLNKELIVFYTFTTKSIPAQTTPTKIIALEKTVFQLSAQVMDIIYEDHIMIKGTKMIPLRKVAEHLGYEVQWHGHSKGVLLKKQNSSIQIPIGQKQYAYNRSLRHFKEAAVLHNNKTYVSEELLELIMQ
jgi:hypothetical protein